jgi:hypothetical protein
MLCIDDERNSLFLIKKTRMMYTKKIKITKGYRHLQTIALPNRDKGAKVMKQ